MKSLCKILEPRSNPKNINHYFVTISKHAVELMSEPVHLPRFGFTSVPFLNWRQDSSPHWWTANNDIKHNRVTSFHQATLKNAFNAIGALMLSIGYFYNRKATGSSVQGYWPDITDSLQPPSTLFRMRSECYSLENRR